MRHRELQKDAQDDKIMLPISADANMNPSITSGEEFTCVDRNCERFKFCKNIYTTSEDANWTHAPIRGVGIHCKRGVSIHRREIYRSCCSDWDIY